MDVGSHVVRRRDGLQGRVLRVTARPDGAYLLVEVAPAKGGAHYLYEPQDVFDATAHRTTKEPTDDRTRTHRATPTDPGA